MPMAAEKENDNGLMLREASMELEMFLPATFGVCAGGESPLLVRLIGWTTLH